MGVYVCVCKCGGVGWCMMVYVRECLCACECVRACVHVYVHACVCEGVIYELLFDAMLISTWAFYQPWITHSLRQYTFSSNN